MTVFSSVKMGTTILCNKCGKFSLVMVGSPVDTALYCPACFKTSNSEEFKAVAFIEVNYHEFTELNLYTFRYAPRYRFPGGVLRLRIKKSELTSWIMLDAENLDSPTNIRDGLKKP